MYEKLVQLFIPYMVNIFGLVEFIKAQGVAGKTLTWVSFTIGIIYGALALIVHIHPNLEPVFTAAIFLPTAGLAASGYYKFIKSHTEKGGKSD